MDPATIATVVFGIVSSLMTAYQLLGQIREARQKQKAGLGHAEPQGPRPEFVASARLSNFANRFSSRLSRNGSSSVDKQLTKDLFALRKELADLLEELRTLKSSSASLTSKKEDSAQTPAEVDDGTLSSWSKRAMGLQRKIEIKIEKMMAPLGRPNGDSDKMGLESIPLGPSGALSNRQFCYGAVLCQHGKADSASLAIENSPSITQSNFSCIHCNLKVGYYESVGVSSNGSPVKTSDLLAACHLMACDSNLRAFYRCLACHLKQKQLDFYTATALEAHMEEHPGFSFLPPKLQGAGEEAAKKDMEEFFAADVSGSQSSMDRQSSHSEEYDDTFPSSLGSRVSEERSVSINSTSADNIREETGILSPTPVASPEYSTFPADNASGDADAPLGKPSLQSPNNDRRNAAANPPLPSRPVPSIPRAELQRVFGDHVQPQGTHYGTAVADREDEGDRHSPSINRSAHAGRVPHTNINPNEANPRTTGTASQFHHMQPFSHDATAGSKIFNPSTYGVQDSYQTGTHRG